MTIKDQIYYHFHHHDPPVSDEVRGRLSEEGIARIFSDSVWEETSEYVWTHIPAILVYGP